MTKLTKTIDYDGVPIEIFGYGHYGRSCPTGDTVELVDVTVGKISIYNILSDDQVESLSEKLLEEAFDSWQYAQEEHADRIREERRMA